MVKVEIMIGFDLDPNLDHLKVISHNENYKAMNILQHFRQKTAVPTLEIFETQIPFTFQQAKKLEKTWFYFHHVSEMDLSCVHWFYFHMGVRGKES